MLEQSQLRLWFIQKAQHLEYVLQFLGSSPISHTTFISIYDVDQQPRVVLRSLIGCRELCQTWVGRREAGKGTSKWPLCLCVASSLARRKNEDPTT